MNSKVHQKLKEEFKNINGYFHNKDKLELIKIIKKLIIRINKILNTNNMDIK